jgi:ATP-dependent RNA helicase DDX43
LAHFFQACINVEQTIEVIIEEDKLTRLLQFIHYMQPDDKLLVFVGRKMMADQLYSELCKSSIKCEMMHSDCMQFDREQALRHLRSGRVRIMIATDVASRGLDVPDIRLYLCFDF